MLSLGDTLLFLEDRDSRSVWYLHVRCTLQARPFQDGLCFCRKPNCVHSSITVGTGESAVRIQPGDKQTNKLVVDVKAAWTESECDEWKGNFKTSSILYEDGSEGES